MCECNLKNGMGGRKDGWCEPPHPFESGGSISVIPRPGVTFYTRGDSTLASSSTTGTGPRGVEMPSPCRVRRRRMCALGGREGGRSKPINLYNRISLHIAGDGARGQLQLSAPADKYGCQERRRRHVIIKDRNESRNRITRLLTESLPASSSTLAPRSPKPRGLPSHDAR